MKKQTVGFVTRSEEISMDIFSLWIDTELAKDAKPGQFVGLFTNDRSALLPRPISICEVNKDKSALRLVYRIAGKGTKEFSHLTAGRRVSLLGVLGNGFPLDEAYDIYIRAPQDILRYIAKKGSIAVNGVSISKFPVVSMNDDDLEIHLLSKMLTDTDYFTIVDKYYINIPVLDEEKYHKPSYDQVFKKEKEKISNLYLIGDNLNENNPVNLIRNFYSQIKNKILTIQKNYLSNNKKALSVNVELLIELEKLIKSCNAITNTVTDYKKSGLKRKLFLEQSDDEDKNKKDKNNFIKEDKKNNKEINSENNKNPYTENKNITENNTNEDNINQNSKKRKQKKKHFKTYLCEFCNKAYSNGQGLGGHMSRIHPNQSYKYKDKIRIRREREKKREKLLNIKQGLFKKYGYDYDKLINDKNKTFIQQFLSEHNEEYRNIRKIQQKQDKNKENSF